jgi:hypothetical protein
MHLQMVFELMFPQDWRMFRSHIASQSSLPTPGARAAL